MAMTLCMWSDQQRLGLLTDDQGSCSSTHF